jgi:hypothetical protein
MLNVSLMPQLLARRHETVDDSICRFSNSGDGLQRRPVVEYQIAPWFAPANFSNASARREIRDASI